MPQKTKPDRSLKWYVLFGFDKSDDEVTGYYAGPGQVTTEVSDAVRFPSKNVNKIQGFGTPKKWCKFINEDRSLNNGYKYHLVHVMK